MSAGDPAVLVMAAGGGVEDGELAAALRSEAERWAHEVAGEGVRFSASPVGAATADVFSDHRGPLLVIWPVLARWRPEYASGALGDLDAGAGFVIGPVIDGGLYLLGLTRPLSELVDVPDDAWSSREALNAALQAAAEAGLEVGMLRAERALRRAEDVDAALADPLTPAEIRAVLAAQ